MEPKHFVFIAKLQAKPKLCVKNVEKCKIDIFEQTLGSVCNMAKTDIFNTHFGLRFTNETIHDQSRLGILGFLKIPKIPGFFKKSRKSEPTFVGKNAQKCRKCKTDIIEPTFGLHLQILASTANFDIFEHSLGSICKYK